MAAWFQRRYALPRSMRPTEVLPVNGTREALFAFAQAVIDASRPSPLVVCPNPFYQIYEGAALLAGAEPMFLNQTADDGFDLDLDSLTDERVARVRSCCTSARRAIRPAACSTSTTGARCSSVSDRYGFVIASDECYSEIYPDEARAAARRAGSGAPAGPRRLPQPGGVHQPVEALERARAALGRRRRRRGAARAVSALSHVSWVRDEPRRAARQHRRVERRGARARQSRALSREVRRGRADARAGAADARRRTPASISGRACPAATTQSFARDLFAATHVTVLPGRYLAREAHGVNPGTRLRPHRARAGD